MRIGSNPAKEMQEVANYGFHRVVVPVYIPHLENYFAHALEILRLCLTSLKLTTARQAAITVIANGCTPVVVEELKHEYETGWLDQLVLNETNRGKVDAVVAVARGSFEPLITIADCDVLFKHGWLSAVERLFQVFPECGFASPFPNPAGEWYYTNTTILGGLVRGELSYERNANNHALERFAQSIGRENMYLPEHRHGQLSVRRQGAVALIGCGHFICTLRREVLAGMPARPSTKALAGDEHWFDQPPDRLGYWRLATTSAFVSHMGNVPEPWMNEELNALRQLPPPLAEASAKPAPARPSWLRVVPLGLRGHLTQALKRIQLRRWYARNAPATA